MTPARCAMRRRRIPGPPQAFSRYVRYDYRLRRATEDREICGDPLRDVRDSQRLDEAVCDRR